MTSNSALQARRVAAVPRGVGTAYPVFAERAEGSELWDVDGNRYVDFGGGIAVLNTGHRHPKVVKAVRDQLDALHAHGVPDRALRALYRTVREAERAGAVFGRGQVDPVLDRRRGRRERRQDRPRGDRAAPTSSPFPAPSTAAR